MTHTPLPERLGLGRSHAAEHQAFLLLRTVFTVAPIVFGLDKFFNLLTDWEAYLAPWINDLVPGSAHTAMLLVGVVEVVAGVVVVLELVALAWLRWRFFRTSFVSSLGYVTLAGIVIGAVSATLGVVG